MFKSELERSEDPKIIAKIITADDLMNLIYQGKHELQDDRFRSFDSGGVFKYFDLNKLINKNLAHQELFYSVIEVGGKIVGLSELEKSPASTLDREIYWLTFIAIDPAYQNQGLSSRLLAEAFKFVKEKEATLETSSYSDEGWKKLKENINKLANEYQIDLIDDNKRLL